MGAQAVDARQLISAICGLEKARLAVRTVSALCFSAGVHLG
jgi:hypothetical protein